VAFEEVGEMKFPGFGMRCSADSELMNMMTKHLQAITVPFAIVSSSESFSLLLNKLHPIGPGG
jgi:hypothetical protein